MRHRPVDAAHRRVRGRGGGLGGDQLAATGRGSPRRHGPHRAPGQPLQLVPHRVGHRHGRAGGGTSPARCAAGASRLASGARRPRRPRARAGRTATSRSTCSARWASDHVPRRRAAIERRRRAGVGTVGWLAERPGPAWTTTTTAWHRRRPAAGRRTASSARSPVTELDLDLPPDRGPVGARRAVPMTRSSATSASRRRPSAASRVHGAVVLDAWRSGRGRAGEPATGPDAASASGHAVAGSTERGMGLQPLVPSDRLLQVPAVVVAAVRGGATPRRWRPAAGRECRSSGVRSCTTGVPTARRRPAVSSAGSS